MRLCSCLRPWGTRRRPMPRRSPSSWPMGIGRSASRLWWCSDGWELTPRRSRRKSWGCGRTRSRRSGSRPRGPPRTSRFARLRPPPRACRPRPSRSRTCAAGRGPRSPGSPRSPPRARSGPRCPSRRRSGCLQGWPRPGARPWTRCASCRRSRSSPSRPPACGRSLLAAMGGTHAAGRARSPRSTWRRSASPWTATCAGHATSRRAWPPRPSATAAFAPSTSAPLAP
mmetsp:Transcript_159069/g.486833  ORF Transcript_159069/g.486833 Transcript_159069/m.486833 type:complete len:227 (+) Transcript_159069:159-839(+)